MELDQKCILAFRRFIFTWWKTNARDLPWRHTRDPYRIWISETMLQQTQVSRVIPVYAAFLEKFPTVKDLADTPLSEVIRAWKGMGYNRRALFLHKTANIIVRNGSFPDTEKEITQFPGVGKYTARAILVFAFRKDVAAVDTNIRRIIIHHFFSDKPQKDRTIQVIADTLVPPGKSWEWHQALMDYGALEMAKFPSVKKKGIPFHNSNRFYRGKILDILRIGPMFHADLRTSMMDGYPIDSIKLDRILESLRKDGLLVKTATAFALPE